MCLPTRPQILTKARFDQGEAYSLHLRHRLAWTVWCLVEWSDLGKGEYGMRRGTQVALSSRSSFRSAVVLLRGVVALLRGDGLLVVRVVALLAHVAVHLPRVVRLPEAVSAVLQLLTTSLKTE
jgi:hypothetical protein